MILLPASWMSESQWLASNLRLCGFTYEKIREELRKRNTIVDDEQLVNCFLRTAMGYTYYFGGFGGTLPYLGFEDERVLITMIGNEAEDLNCMPTQMVINPAHELRSRRSESAIEMLIEMNCPRLADRIDCCPVEPTTQWLTGWARAHQLWIKAAEGLDKVRRRTCSKQLIFLRR